MTIYWVRTDNDSALLAMQAVERALAQHDTGSAPSETVVSAVDLTNSDSYLAENLRAAHEGWSIDLGRFVEAGPSRFGGLFQATQRLVQRATWWYHLPRWQQVTLFHATIVRIVDSLLEHQRQLRERVKALEEGRTPLARMQVLEEHLQMLRTENIALQSRVIRLEEELAALRSAVDV